MYLRFIMGVLTLLLLTAPVHAQSVPSISNISDNRQTYPTGQIPKYEKFELSFSVTTQATNLFYPYDASPPPGIAPSTGVSVNAIFTDPQGTSYTQPAFLYQDFQDQIKNNKEWFYPTSNFLWKVRFSPNKTGTWQYRIVAQDTNGTTQTTSQSFTVTNSTNHGFINVSSTDKRYFTYDDGTYFPALGYNLNGGDLDNVNPTLGNIPEFSVMQENGIQLSRVWITQFSVYGEAYGKWISPNRVHGTQEPRLGIVNPISSQITTNYPGYTPPTLAAGSEYYMWLEFNETVSSDGTQQRFTPCRYISQIPVKQNTNYRVRVRYQESGIEGPKVAGIPYGFTVKTSTSSLSNATSTCNEPTAGTVVAATYTPSNVSSDPQNPGWSILTGTLNSGATDFLYQFYLTFNNVKSQDSDLFAGHVFIDEVWLEEASCTSNCPNLLTKANMDMHQYINQRDAYAVDKLLDTAKQYDIYLKAVMLEKNDRIFQSIDFTGQPTANNSIVNFYGNRRTVTKVRWLQQAWWRYMQARWGYSPNIHSWELLNEGHTGNSEGHWDMADEFGKYMQCRVFNISVSSVNPYQNCQYDHPNNHLITTSFFGSSFPWQFWNNQASGIDLTFAEMDYADQHMYATEGTTDPLQFYDAANFSYWLSTQANFAPAKIKPFIRGEAGWSFAGTDVFIVNSDNGQWLHEYIWAGINAGGLIEHYFAGGNFTKHIYNISGSTVLHDHRPMFKPYYNFIRDIPLANGSYTDAQATSTNQAIRAWGQKDSTNNRAHLWISNKNHTWKAVVDNTTITPQSATITINGFTPNTVLSVQWWNTYTGAITQQTTTSTTSTGQLSLQVANLTTDTAVKIGNYSLTPTPTLISLPPVVGDANNDQQVNNVDYTIWKNQFLSPAGSANFNNDTLVSGLDFILWLLNYGT